MSLRIFLSECAHAFAEARTGNRNVASIAAKNFCDELNSLLPAEARSGMNVKSGLGMGRFADVPWIAVLNEKFGGSATSGYYVVFLFSKDSERIYLTLGVGSGAGASGGWTLADRQRVENSAHKLRSRCHGLKNYGFELSSDLDLATSVWRAKSYAAATSAFKCYHAEKLPDIEDLKTDFLHLFQCFSSLIKEGFSLDNLMENISGKKMPATVISRALLSKPFLILTGPSGTGKTRGAVQLAASLCDPECRAVVAVGADWTDNRHVVGFLNPLQTEDGTPAGTPIYEATEILKLLLHANAYPDQPHVLILDEMNLSHVERYFADFLSAMELEDKEKSLKLHSAGLAKTREGLDVEGSIDFPENLFVIGTVNIDETTYMFSPKVLDRANVIEIHADAADLEKVLNGETATTGGPSDVDCEVSFIEAARVIRQEQLHDKVPVLPPDVRGYATERLMDLFKIMRRGRGEFGFRTGREVMAYLRTVHFLTPEGQRAGWAAEKGDWQKAMDAQILQKILPKLHGSRSRLAPLLGALATYCAKGQLGPAMEHFPENGNTPKRGLNDARNIETQIFAESYKKLERMIDVMVEEQFVSFIC